MAGDRATFPIVVHTLLDRAGEWFVLRRARTGYLDGAWTLPGGHVRAGESILWAARRECMEEAGVTVDVAALAVVAVMPYRAGDQQGVDFILRAGAFDGEPRLAEPEHFDACRWASPEALPEPVAPFIAPLREMLRSGEWFRELSS